MNRRPLRLRLGADVLELLPDGRVVVLHRGALAMPDASAPQIVYPSLRALIEGRSTAGHPVAPSMVRPRGPR